MKPSGRTSSLCSGDARFAATRWSIVFAAAGHQDTGHSRRAMGELIQAYWFPLYAFIRRKGNGPQQAEDLTQSFFIHLMKKESLATVDGSRGKFRSFLLASVKNFMADQWDKACAKKRGGDRQQLSLDALDAESQYPKELADTMTPERLFERSWAIAVLNQVLLRLEREYTEGGKAKAFKLLRNSLEGQPDGQSHADIAGQLGISEGSARVMAHRMRKRYREILRDEISQTVAADEVIDEEIRYLLQCL